MDEATDALLAELDRLADRVRHPALQLDRFTDDPNDSQHAVHEQELRTRRRRAAVIYAANLIVEECLEDQHALDWDKGSGRRPQPRRADRASRRPVPPRAVHLPVPDGDPALSFVWRFFPSRFRAAYDAAFFGKVLVSAVKVGYDLARVDGGPPACIAEQLVVRAVCQIAEEVMDSAGLGQPRLPLTKALLEGVDFVHVFFAEMDGIAADPAIQGGRGRRAPDVSEWFVPFDADQVVHPFAETAATVPVEQDPGQRLCDDEDTESPVRESAEVDDPAPVTGLAAVSDVVALARAAESPGNDRVWVADASSPESSYADLVRASEFASSGWLTWTPHEGVDTVRTDRVILFRPHRHLLDGVDQPWAEVAVSRVVMSVPLSVVVSFRPDPQVRQDWEDLYKGWFVPGSQTWPDEQRDGASDSPGR